MTVEVQIDSLNGLDSAFGTIGLKVGPRTGPNKRTKDDKEWYVVRRFLPAALSARLFKLPLRVVKTEPPEPDFNLFAPNLFALLEITEATDPADQREMRAFEQSEDADLLGTHGGRFHGGASGKQPERIWAQDILDAIIGKEGKAIFSNLGRRHLVIYPNSNASFLMFNNDDEVDAYKLLDEKIREQKDLLFSVVNGCQVHILGKAYVFLDVLGASQLTPRAGD